MIRRCAQLLLSGLILCGLLLMFERPIEAGDIEQVGELTGMVRHIGFRSSTIRAFEGSSVIVPNGNLISNEVINWTHSDPSRRVELRVGVAYGTDPERGLELLVRTASQHPDVNSEPASTALFKAFGDSSLDFALRYRTNHFSRWTEVASQVAVAVNAACVEAGIEIPFPQRTLHVASWSEEAKPPAGSESSRGSLPS